MANTTYRIKPGECVASVAFKAGLLPDTVWAHPENSELRAQRRDLNVLQPGDELVVPAPVPRNQTHAAGQKYRFVRKAVPALVRLVFYTPQPDPPPPETNMTGGDDTHYEDPDLEVLPEQRLLSDAPYRISIDGEWREGKSGPDGIIEVPVSPDAAQAEIEFFPGTKEELVFEVALGHIDPPATVTGARHRLSNLGYPCPPDGAEPDDVSMATLTQFQADQSLEPSGNLDEATQAKLVDLHGS
ncbi:MAG: hypothetical protein AAGG11_17640 [Pseudomonadota bacterium]